MYKPPALGVVPHDGALVVTTNSEDMDSLFSELQRKIIAVCEQKIANALTVQDVDLALSFYKLQPQTIMLVSWKVDIPEDVLEYAKMKECVLVCGDAEMDAKNLVRLVMDQFVKRNKALKPTWVMWKDMPGYGCQLTVWHKLSNKAVKQLATDACTHVVSLLGDKEKPHLTGEWCAKANIQWIWVNIQGAKDETLISHAEALKEGVETVFKLFDKPTKILIHCSAGVHRTGTFTYSLLRKAGFSPSEARDLLYEIRPVTARQVGENRIQIAEEYIIPLL